VEVQFLSDSIQFSPKEIHPYVWIGFGIFWFLFSFVGWFFPDNPAINRWKLPLTLICFLPFSFLCLSEQLDTSTDVWTGEIRAPNRLVRIKDFSTSKELVFPFADFQSYVIESSSESKKEGWDHTDAIFLRHKSGLLLPVGRIDLKERPNQPFSRYAETSRNMRRYLKILNLPILDIYLDPFQGLLLSQEPIDEIQRAALDSPDLVSSQKNLELDQKNEELRFPIRWNHKVGIGNYFFVFGLLVIGHFGVLMTKSTLGTSSIREFWIALIVGIFAYLAAVLFFYFRIYENKNKLYEIQKTTSGYEFYSQTSTNPPKLLGSYVRESGKRVSLTIHPHRHLEFYTEEMVRAAKTLIKSLESGNVSVGKTWTEAKALTQAGKETTFWDLSDLPMEVAVRFFLVLSPK